MVRIIVPPYDFVRTSIVLYQFCFADINVDMNLHTKQHKCSSCKCYRSAKFFAPIICNGRKIIPKTCSLCRDRRNSYYRNFESKKISKAIRATRVQKKETVNDSGSSRSTQAEGVTTNSIAVPLLPEDIPAISPAVSSEATLNSLPLFDEENMYDINDDMIACDNSLQDMVTFYGNMATDDLISELERQTINSLCHDISYFSDALAVTQVDLLEKISQ